MHRCLQVFDILECICLHLLSSNSLDALANLARTCTLFLDPALDTLWHTIPTLEPLIKCLPDDAWTIRYSRYHPVLLLTRNTTKEDWGRCAFYTPRIRHFGYNDLENYTLPGQLKGSVPTDRSIHIALRPSDPENKTPNSFLTFPKLRSCKLLQHTSYPIPHYSPFLTQTLVSLEVRPPAYDDDGFLLGILRSVPLFSPSLRKLEIQGISSLSSLALTHGELQRRDLGIQEALVQTLHSLQYLEELVCLCVPLPKNALRYLATETKIRLLHIENSADHILNALPEDDSCFSYLEDLLLRCCSDGGLVQCSQLLERVDNIQNLRSIEIWRDLGLPGGSEIGEFIHSLHDLITCPTSSNRVHRQSAPNTRFEKLCIRENSSFIGMQPLTTGYTITLDTLEPLLSFTQLAHLRIMTEDRYAFDNSDAYKMANAWPKLQELQLGLPGIGWGRMGRREENWLTLEGLRAFARGCKDLIKLGVCFDMTAAHCEENDEDDTNAEEIAQGSRTVHGVSGDAVHFCDSLEVLNVGDSVYYGEPVQIARSLLKIFPKLRGVAGPEVATSVEWQRKWVSVTLLIRELSERLPSFY